MKYMLLGTLFFIASATTALGIDAVNPDTVHWRYGTNVCKGSWAYKEYKSCRHKNFGVERYKKARTKHCGIESYKTGTHKDCGAKRYNNGTGAVCGNLYKEGRRSVCGEKPRIGWCCDGQPGICDDNNVHGVMEKCFKGYKTCRHSSFGREGYKSCEHSQFGVRTYKTCQHSSFGVASYKSCRNSNHGPDLFKTGTGAVCGTKNPLKFTEKSFPLSQIKGEKNLIPTLGASCTTCDDLPIGTPEQVQKKYKCLKLSLSNAEEGVTEFGFPELKEAVKALKFLQKIKGDYLSEEQNGFVTGLYDHDDYELMQYD